MYREEVAACIQKFLLTKMKASQSHFKANKQ